MAINTAKGRVRVVGSGHSTSDISDTDGMQISLEEFKDIDMDNISNEVTFGAGVTFAELIGDLADQNRALLHLPSLPTEQTVISSVMTGAHGTGIHEQPISSLVKSVSFVDPKGQKRFLSKADGDDFTRFLHSFGTLGIVYSMTMDSIVMPYFVRNCVYKDVSWSFFKNQSQFD